MKSVLLSWPPTRWRTGREWWALQHARGARPIRGRRSSFTSLPWRCGVGVLPMVVGRLETFEELGSSHRVGGLVPKAGESPPRRRLLARQSLREEMA